MDGDNEDAVRHAQEAVKNALDSESEERAYLSLAHGYLFSEGPNNLNKARELYKQHKSNKVDPYGSTFAMAALDDFKYFRRAGMDRPEMIEIENEDLSDSPQAPR